MKLTTLIGFVANGLSLGTIHDVARAGGGGQAGVDERGHARLGAERRVDGVARHVRRLRDLANRRAGVAARREELPGGLDDPRVSARPVPAGPPMRTSAS